MQNKETRNYLNSANHC